MALPSNTMTVLDFMTPGFDLIANELADVDIDANTIVRWDESLGVQPTEQQINDAATDQPGTEQDHGDGPELFSSWLAKHGGNPTRTERFLARQAATSTDFKAKLARGVILMVVQLLHQIIDHLNDPLTKPIPPKRTIAQLKAALAATIDSGNAFVDDGSDV